MQSPSLVTRKHSKGYLSIFIFLHRCRKRQDEQGQGSKKHLFEMFNVIKISGLIFFMLCYHYKQDETVRAV